MGEAIPKKILIITTHASSYPGANAVGQAHREYSPDTFVMRVPDPVLFPVDFYLKAFSKGIGGIIIMSSGSDCPYEGAYEKLAARVQTVYASMRETGLSIERLKLTTICTVCVSAFIKEVNAMVENLSKLRSAAA